MSSTNEPAMYAAIQSVGFPSPADDYVEKKLDLNEYLIRNRQATFFLRASGDSMVGAGIHNGDLLIVDRSLPASHKKIVVAIVGGDLVVRRLVRTQDSMTLTSENQAEQPIEITPELGVEIWGVVTRVIHDV